MNKKVFSALLTFVVFGVLIYLVWNTSYPWYIKVSISIAAIGIRLVIFALIGAKPSSIVAGDEYQSFTSRNTSLSLHPTTKLTLIKMLNFSLLCLGAYVFLVWVAPALYAVANPAHPSEPGKEVVRTTTDATGQQWEEHCLPITKEWTSFAFEDKMKSELWPTKDSLLVRYANGTQQVTLYPKFMGKVTDVHFYSNHFELKLPDTSPHESDEVIFKLAVN